MSRANAVGSTAGREISVKAAIVLLALLASCEGRCRPVAAVIDEVPGGMCAASFDGTSGICLRGDEVFTCSVAGMLWHTATCRQIGTATK